MAHNQSNDWLVVAVPIGLAAILFIGFSLLLDLIIALIATGVLFGGSWLLYTAATKKLRDWKAQGAARLHDTQARAREAIQSRKERRAERRRDALARKAVKRIKSMEE